jgi:hypothetical protein
LAAVGTLRVELVLIGAAAVSLPEAALQWKDGDRVQEHLALLQASGGMWDASIPGGKGGSFADTPSALAARLTQADIVLRF